MNENVNDYKNLLSKTIIIIPARFGSSRFIGKPLALIGSKPMIYYTYMACLASGVKTIISTDDKRIYSKCLEFVSNKEDVKISPCDIDCGTKRVIYEAKKQNYEYVINLQADEPLINAHLINKIINNLKYLDKNTPTLSIAIKRNYPKFKNMYNDPNTVKLVLNKMDEAMYFSRSGIPGSKNNDISFFYQHVGIYAFVKSYLLEYDKESKTIYEKIEDLEQLRILENGKKIKIILSEDELISVDNPQDLDKVKTILEKKGALL